MLGDIRLYSPRSSRASVQQRSGSKFNAFTFWKCFSCKPAFKPRFSTFSQPRQNSKELREYWRAKAKEKVKANKLARSFHDADTVLDSTEKSMAEEPWTQNVSLTWTGFPLIVEGLINEGTYGSVYRVKTADGFTMAAKVLKDYPSDAPCIQDDMDNLKDISKEISLHHRVSASPYILRALGVASVSLHAKGVQSSCLLTELGKFTVQDVLQRESKSSASFSFNEKFKWCVQIGCGLCHLHGQRIVHLDLKVNNCLLFESNDGASTSLRATIGDFGLSRQVDDQGQVTVCTNGVYNARYRPPECTALQTLEPLERQFVFLVNEMFIIPDHVGQTIWKIQVRGVDPMIYRTSAYCLRNASTQTSWPWHTWGEQAWSKLWQDIGPMLQGSLMSIPCVWYVMILDWMWHCMIPWLRVKTFDFAPGCHTSQRAHQWYYFQHPEASILWSYYLIVFYYHRFDFLLLFWLLRCISHQLLWHIFFYSCFSVSSLVGIQLASLLQHMNSSCWKYHPASHLDCLLFVNNIVYCLIFLPFG